MGYFLKDHDIHVNGLLEQMNLRFAPSQGRKTHFGGLEEMIELQKEFKIFKKGRPFRVSVAVLNIGGGHNELKTLMHQYLDNLSSHASEKPNQNGDEAIVAAMIRNLAAAEPLPVYFTFHDMRAEKGNTRVLITERGRPLPFVARDYLTISLPMMAPKASPPKKKASPVAKKASKP